MKRIVCSTGAALMVLAFFWVAGFDLNERGLVAFEAALLSTGAFFIVYTLLGLDK